jgi:hypothetical protein
VICLFQLQCAFNKFGREARPERAVGRILSELRRRPGTARGGKGAVMLADRTLVGPGLVT